MPKVPIEQPLSEIPAGHTRDETIRERQDAVEETIQAQADDPDGLQAMEARKLRRIDNEIASKIQRDGRIHISNAQPGYEYGWLPHVKEYEGEARANVRVIHATARAGHWDYVKENDPEARELIGNDAAGPTTLRGWGDCVLVCIKKEDLRALEEKNQRKQDKLGAVEERLQYLGTQRGLTVRGFAGDLPNDPLLQNAFRGYGGTERYQATSTFNEGDIRRGSIPGLPVGGRK